MNKKVERLTLIVAIMSLLVQVFSCNIVRAEEAKSVSEDLENQNKVFGDFTYNEVEDGIKIIRYKGNNSEVEIPDKIDEKDVVEIGEEAFYELGYYEPDMGKIRKLKIPDSVKKIGPRAFGWCNELMEINIPEGIKEIGEGCFEECSKLKSIKLPKSLEIIGRNAFEYSGLETIIIPNKVRVIDSFAFYKCDELNYVKLSDDLDYVGGDIFSYCSSLKSVRIAEGMTKIPKEIYKNNNFEYIYIPKNSKLESCEEDIYEHTKEILGYPNTYAESLGKDKFHSLVDIESDFEYIDNGKDLTITKYKGNESDKVFIPDEIEGKPVSVLGNGDSLNCNYAKEIVIMNGINIIEDNCFKGCERLEKIMTPASLQKVGQFAFEGDKELKNITFFDSLKYVEKGAFKDCTNLGEVDFLSYNVDKINDETFKSCGELRKIISDHHISNIGREAFKDCVKLNYIKLDLAQNIEDSAFENCTSLGWCDLLNIVNIGESAFKNSGTANDLSLSKKLNSIGKSAFKGCNYIGNVYIPDSTTYVGEYAFADCSELEKITIGDNLKVVNDNVFSNCNSLKELKISDKVEKIGDNNFSNCSKLYTIYLPTSLVSIGNNNFNGFKSLKFLTIPENCKSVGENCFNNCNTLEKVYFPRNITEISDKSFINNPKVRVFTSDKGEGKKFAIRNNYLYSITGDNDNNLLYDVYPEEIKITGYTKGKKDIVIPKKIDNIKVRTIEKGAFYGNDEIRSIDIAYGVEGIGQDAFATSENLSTVKIPKSVTKIGEGAFDFCGEDLTIYGVKGSVAEEYAKANDISFKEVPDNEFDEDQFTYVEGSYTAKITSYKGNRPELIVPSKVNNKVINTIGSKAFANSVYLRKVVLPETITTVGSSSFENCINLEKITIPKTVTYIGKGAFNGCENIVISGEAGSYVESYAKENGIKFETIKKDIVEPKFEYEEKTYSAKIVSYTGNVSEVSLADSVNNKKVNTIGSGVFKGHDEIEKIILPSSIEVIGRSCFEGCTSLTRIDIPFSVSYIGADAFKNCTKVIIYGQAGSYAEKYAKENNIAFVEK